MKWENVTSYSKKDTDRATPRTWAAKAGEFRIVVTRHVHYEPDVWTLTCNPFFDNHELACKEISEAKREALALVEMRLLQAVGAVQSGNDR